MVQWNALKVITLGQKETVNINRLIIANDQIAPKNDKINK